MELLNNNAQTTKYFNSIFQQALDLTMEELLNNLKEWIDADVYSWWSNSEQPWDINRTFQFKDSWKSTKSEIINNIINSTIEQDISVMKKIKIGGHIVHEDAENLSEIINSGNGYNFGQAEGEPRPFWNDFIKEVDMKLDSIFIKNCKKLGVDIK